MPLRGCWFLTDSHRGRLAPRAAERFGPEPGAMVLGGARCMVLPRCPRWETLQTATAPGHSPWDREQAEGRFPGRTGCAL